VSRRRKRLSTAPRVAPVGWEKAPSLSLTEAAAVLSTSRSTAYTWAEDGRLPTTRDHLGDHRVKPADLQRLLAETAVQPPLPEPTGDRWLGAVRADPRLTGPERESVLAVAAWLADRTDDQGVLSPEASALVAEAVSEGADA